MKGRDKYLRRLKALRNPSGPINHGLRVIAERVRSDAQKSITISSASGDSGGKHQHVPSRPGEPPNNDTGGLAKGIVDETFPAALRAEVRAEAPHSEALEFGTSKMEPRAFLRPARDKNAGFTNAVMKKQMAEFVKRSGR